MKYDDELIIATPEGVDLTIVLAGVGSRFVSALIDLSIQGVLIVMLSLFATGVGLVLGSGYGAAAVAVLSFAVIFGYDVFFEVLQSGQTPGKRLNGLRVVQENGAPITFIPSTVRNVLRIVDFLPAGYLTGIVAVLVTRRNQRLGDLVAGTLVVRERFGAAKGRPTASGVSLPPRALGSPTLDVTALTADETVAVRQYLERRGQIDEAARRQLAATLANRLRPKVNGSVEGMTADQFLEAIDAVRTDLHGRTAERPPAV